MTAELKPTHKLLSNIFDSFRSNIKVSRALSTIARRNVFSVFGSNPGLPTGWTIPAPTTIRIEPIMEATGVIVHTWAVGMPILSNSFVIAAPQRVLDPQVEVKITALTPSALSCSAISFPNFCEFARLAATPAVVMNDLWSRNFPSRSKSRITSKGMRR
jgi:hypothetical protein